MSNVEVVFTTNPGIEDIVAEEVSAKLGATILEQRSGRGRVLASVPLDYIDLVDSLRSIHRARILLYRGRICEKKECLETIKEAIHGTDIIKYVTPFISFAVRAERVGEHDYSSLDIARVAGDAVIKVVEKAHGARPRVDLDYPSVIVDVDVINDELYVSIELGGDLSWHRRGYRIYDHPAALKPTLAYAMLRISGVRDGDTVLDPMCGGGTVVIEAAYLLESSRIICLDKNPRHIMGARLNARAALVEPRIEFVVGDATRLSKYINRADIIVSNPPYGIRMGSPREVRALYKRFLEEAVKVIDKSITIITTEHVVAKQVLSRYDWEIVEDRIVAHGNLHPHIIVAKR